METPAASLEATPNNMPSTSGQESVLNETALITNAPQHLQELCSPAEENVMLNTGATLTDESTDQEFSDMDTLNEGHLNDSLPISDSFESDGHSVENNIAQTDIEENEGIKYAKEVLNRFENLPLNHPPTTEEYAPLLLQDILFGAGKNKIRNMESFLQYMRELAKVGLFEHFYNTTKIDYKSQLWLDAQHMRLRCSLIYQAAIRKDSSDDENLMDYIFCYDREFWMEERISLKQQKRFLMKNMESIYDRCYQECGLMLNPNYPYLCASPDGITNDYIVEIKMPVSMEEYEKYLEGGENIPHKYMAQLQMQMFMADMNKALYCVQHPDFDLGEKVHFIWVLLNVQLVVTLLNAAEDFWKNVVFASAH